MVSFELNYSSRTVDPKPVWAVSERLDYCDHNDDEKNGFKELQAFFRDLFRDIL